MQNWLQQPLHFSKTTRKAAVQSSDLCTWRHAIHLPGGQPVLTNGGISSPDALLVFSLTTVSAMLLHGMAQAFLLARAGSRAQAPASCLRMRGAAHTRRKGGPSRTGATRRL